MRGQFHTTKETPPAMSPASDTVVTGAAQTPFNRRRDGTGFRDWARSAAEAAIAMSTLDRDEIAALFLASESDFFAFQLNPASILASELGLAGCQVMRCEGGGASGQIAVHAATHAILSGRMRHVLVLGTDPSASSLSGEDVTTLYRYSLDAWTDGMTGASATALYALSYQAFAASSGATDADLAMVTRQNRANAGGNPNAHLPRTDTEAEIAASPLIASPYRRLHCSPLSDGAAALVLSHAAHVPGARRSAPRIAGIGAASDHMHLGARARPGEFAAKTRAMQRACDMAGIAPGDIGLAEIYDAYAGAQLQALQALGLGREPVRHLRAGHFAPDGRCPVNLSGGLLGQGAPVGATGVAQTASCALMLEGRYHPALQPADPPAHALADTHGGICTNSAVTILQRGQAA